MNLEQETILGILRGFISDTEASPATGLDWQSVLDYSVSHQIAGIVYYKCKSVIPQELLPRFQKAYFSCISNYTNKISLLKKIDQAFSENGIRYIVFKGSEIAKLYPVPELRSMGDLDILVSMEDKERAADLMLELGFSGDDRRDMEWCFVKNGMEFELHHKLLYDETVNTETDQAFCDRAWDYARPADDNPGSTRYVLDVNYHFIYILLHIKKHILNKGIGLRQFFDAAVWQKSAGLDTEKVDQMIREVGIERFAEVALELCGRWFGQTKNEFVFPDDFYENATRTIFENGVFGDENETNSENHMLNNVRSNGKFKTVLSRIFPPYSAFYYVPHYSFIQGKPYLLPIAWIYRFYRAIRYKKIDESRQYVNDVINSDSKLTEREKMLKIWGI